MRCGWMARVIPMEHDFLRCSTRTHQLCNATQVTLSGRWNRHIGTSEISSGLRDTDINARVIHHSPTSILHIAGAISFLERGRVLAPPTPDIQKKWNRVTVCGNTSQERGHSLTRSQLGQPSSSYIGGEKAEKGVFDGRECKQVAM